LQQNAAVGGSNYLILMTNRWILPLLLVSSRYSLFEDANS
jgi:hypothetical protein